MPRVHSIFHSCLEQAVQWGLLGRNPASLASPPRDAASEVCPPVAGLHRWCSTTLAVWRRVLGDHFGPNTAIHESRSSPTVLPDPPS